MTFRENSAIGMLVVCMVIAAGFGIASADWVTATVATGMDPCEVAVNPVTNKIYVANLATRDVTIIEGTTNETTRVAAAWEPWALAVNPTTNKIYVANFMGFNVTVIDGATNDTTLVPAGTEPYAVAVNPVTNKIYVANFASADVTVIDGATNDTTLVPAGAHPCAVAVNPVTDKIYVANLYGADVTVIDGTTNTTTSVLVGQYPSAVAVDQVTDKIYVANSNSDNVTVIDGATNAATTVAAGAAPGALAVNPTTDRIYVANDSSYDVTVITDAPANDTKVHAAFDLLPGDTTALARPTLTGKGVNRSTPEGNVMMGVCNRMKTTQIGWNWANVTSGAGTDSIEWTYDWGADSLIPGENFVCAQPLESDAGTTNNEGMGTPFAGNLEVYPLYRMAIPVGVSDRRRQSGIGVLALSVFPNPCPAKAQIAYSLPRPGNISLKLYDVMGRLTAMLAEGYHAAGRYNVLLTPTLSSERRGSNLAQGVYLLRLKTSDGVKTQKLIIE